MVDYSEISEKKTTKLGYLILIVLFIFLVIIGNTILRDVSKIPIKPIAPTYCANNYLKATSTISYTSSCQYTDIDYEFGIDKEIENLHLDFDRLINVNQEYNANMNKISSNERKIESLLLKYDITLQETMADEESLFDKPEIKQEITLMVEENNQLSVDNQNFINERNSFYATFSAKLVPLQDSYDQAIKSYNRRKAWFGFKVFFMKLLFVLPFFLASMHFYFKYKKKDSPYTIILTSIFFASSILMLEVVLIFLYDIIPKEWWEILIEFFTALAALRYVLYYLSVAVVIAVLGGIVYYIQKNVYNPQRVAMRRLKEKKCPGCSFDLALSSKFCPNCGFKLKSECPKCHKERYKDLPVCPFCGDRTK